MKAKNGRLPVPALIPTLKQSKGYYLCGSLLSLCLLIVLLRPSNLYAWVIGGLLAVRVLRFRSRALNLVTLGMLLVTLGAALYHLSSQGSRISGKETEVMLYVDINELKVNGDLLSGYAQVMRPDAGQERVAFFYQLSSPEEKEYFAALSTSFYLSVSGEFEKPEASRNLYQFDYAFYLKSRDIQWTFTLDVINQLVPDHSWRSFFPNLRRGLYRLIEERVQFQRSAAYLSVLLFNRENILTDDTAGIYRELGVIHLFSISGMHIQLFIRHLRNLLLRLRITHETTDLLLLASLLLYGILTGWGIGITRAVMTEGIMLAGKLVKTGVDAKDAFAGSLLLHLAINPYFVLQASFQLSYLLTAVLYFIAPAIEARPLSRIVKELLVTVLLTAVSFPVLSYHFYEMAWIGVLVNVVYSYLFSWLLIPLFWLVFFLVLLVKQGWAATGIIRMLEYALFLMEEAGRNLVKVNVFTMITGRQALCWYLLLFVPLVLVLMRVEQGKSLIRPLCIAALAILCFYLLPYLNPTGKVAALDVGQGDALLIKTPFDQFNVLIDTGGELEFEKEPWQVRSSRSAEEELANVLKAEGIRRLDAVFLTHSDVDHIGNLLGLSRYIPIRKVYYGAGAESEPSFAGLLEQLTEEGIECISLLAPITVSFADWQLQVLHPAIPGSGANKDSLVLYADIAGRKWLFTGDIDAETEQELMESYPDLEVDILKIAHHGSGTSTSRAFLQLYRPETAVISAGKNNRYGHPEAEVISRLQDEKIQIYRTDQQGAIHFSYFLGHEKRRCMLQ